MKHGKTLTELAVELERQKEAKRDFLADSRSLEMTDDMKLLMEGVTSGEVGSSIPIDALPINELAHDQIGSRLKIPAKYYDRMRRESPGLLARNVNHWFKANPEKRMIRTLDGDVRAFLSNRYRPLDNFNLAEAVMPTLSKLQCEVKSCEITERRMYIKAVTDRITADIGVGDIVQAGAVISNSEVGSGSLRVEFLVFILSCENGMISGNVIRKYHVGRGNKTELDEAVEYFKDETRRADDKAFFMKVRDIVEGTLTQDAFDLTVAKMRAAKKRVISVEADVIEVVEVFSETFGLKDTEQSGVLQHLIKGGDLSQLGMSNAFTRTAQDVASYDRSTELERTGGQIIELDDTQWAKLAKPTA